MLSLRDKIKGSLYGAFIGDALGHQVDGYSIHQARDLFYKVDRYKNRGTNTKHFPLIPLLRRTDETIEPENYKFILVPSDDISSCINVLPALFAKLAGKEYCKYNITDLSKIISINHTTRAAHLAIFIYIRALINLFQTEINEFDEHNFCFSVDDACIIVSMPTYHKPLILESRFNLLVDKIHALSKLSRLLPKTVHQNHKLDAANLFRYELSDMYSMQSKFGKNNGKPENIIYLIAQICKNPCTIETLYKIITEGNAASLNGAVIGSLLGALHGYQFFPGRLISGLENYTKIDEAIEFFLRGIT